MRNIAVVSIRVFLGLIFFSSGMEGLFTHHSFPELTRELFASIIGFVICIGIQYFEVDLKQMLHKQYPKDI